MAMNCGMLATYDQAKEVTLQILHALNHYYEYGNLAQQLLSFYVDVDCSYGSWYAYESGLKVWH